MHQPGAWGEGWGEGWASPKPPLHFITNFQRGHTWGISHSFTENPGPWGTEEGLVPVRQYRLPYCSVVRVPLLQLKVSSGENIPKSPAVVQLFLNPFSLLGFLTKAL